MAASSSESQGIKIALVAFVVLTVILGVTVYFTASSSSQSAAKLAAANEEKNKADAAARKAVEEANFWRTKSGYGAQEDFDAAKAAATKDVQRITGVVQAIGARSAQAVNEVRKAGEANPKLDALLQAIQSDIQAIVTEPNENQVYLKTFDRLALVLSNQSDLMTQLALNYQGLRSNLESANKVNQSEMNVVAAARDKANADKEAEIARNAQEIQDLRKKVDDYQTELANRATALTNLENKAKADDEAAKKVIGDLRTVVRDLKDQVTLKETELGRPAGRVTYVNYNGGEVRVNVNRSQGARPLMRLTVFDQTSAGIPNQKPKGIVELTRVGDPSRGEFDSVGRIVETKEPTNPIRSRDFIYSPVWSPENPLRFALIGKLDVDRDGRDDRAELIRMIEAAGGMIEFDLPPADVSREPGRAAVARTYAKLGQPMPAPVGRESGRISGLATAYITDNRLPLVRSTGRPPVETKEDQVYQQEASKATREARDNGVRPMELARLLTFLGYDYTSPPSHARVEAKSKEGLKELVKPKGTQMTAPPAGGDATPPAQPPAAGDNAAPADAPKNENQNQ